MCKKGVYGAVELGESQKTLWNFVFSLAYKYVDMGLKSVKRGLKIFGNEVGIVFREIRTICGHGQARWVGSKSSSVRVSEEGLKCLRKLGFLPRLL